MTVQGGIVIKQDWQRDRDSVTLGVQTFDIEWVFRPDGEREFAPFPSMTIADATLWQVGESMERAFRPVPHNVGRWTRIEPGVWEWRVFTHVDALDADGTVIATIRVKE